MRAIRRFTVRPVLPRPWPAWATSQATSVVLAPESQDVFEEVDPVLWQSTGRDPVAAGAVGGSGWRARRRRGVLGPARLGARGPRPLPDRRPLVPEAGGGRRDLPRAIGYFSPEFGITSVLPQYSGGLGILAGDHLKAASDLGVLILGVGLLYRHGYFKQSLARGLAAGDLPRAGPSTAPDLAPARREGRPRLDLHRDAGRPPTCWPGSGSSVGRVPLLMLDTDVEGNPDHYRDVTDRLYGGNSEHRLRQELLLGVGGSRDPDLLPHHRAPRAGGLPHQRGPRRLPSAWSASGS